MKNPSTSIAATGALAKTAPPGTYPFTTSLPDLGTYESPTLEFKASLPDAPSYFELAKDVSAMANAWGGTILVGARGGNSQLVKYEPIATDDQARTIALAYENAVKDRCSPVPTFSIQALSIDDGTLLAIHVPPSFGLVGVRTGANDPKSDWRGDAWTFFRREAASQNKEIRPERFPMLMSAELRRIAIILQSIPQEATVHITKRRSDDERKQVESCTLVAVEEEKNRVVFSKVTVKKDAPRTSAVVVPLDQILTAFEGVNGEWQVDVAHYYEHKPFDAKGMRALNAALSSLSVSRYGPGRGI